MKLGAEQKDFLTELVNMGIGRAAGVLNTMLQSHVTLRVPAVQVLSELELEAKMDSFGHDVLSSVRLEFKGHFSGIASLVFPTESAAKLVSIVTEEEDESLDLDSIRVGTLTEVGNIVLNGVMGVIGNELGQQIRYSVPNYIESPIEQLLVLKVPVISPMVIWVQTRFSIQQHHIDGDIILIFEVGSFSAFIAAIDTQMELRA